MKIDFFHLELSLIEAKLNYLNTITFSDNRLNPYLSKLIELRKLIEAEISGKASLTDNEVNAFKMLFNFIKLSLNFLDGSRLNTIPFETVFCLKKALNDWVDSKNLVIVTSLNYNSYFFNSTLSLQEPLYIFIESKYKIKFDERLILLSIPEFEISNYLYNIVLYHELGHFIDLKYKISDKIMLEKHSDIKNNPPLYSQQKRYYMEHFADIFAAQYVSDKLNDYLDFIAGDNKDSSTHPSTQNRIKVVDDFLSGAKNDICTTIKSSSSIITKHNLEKRCSEIQSDDFENFLPVEIQDEKELHGIYQYGWDQWKNRDKIFMSIDSSNSYRIVNNLIEKSISNYLVKSIWNK